MDALRDAQALLEHAHVTTTMRYVHHVPGARAADLLAAVFADEDPLKRAVSTGSSHEKIP